MSVAAIPTTITEAARLLRQGEYSAVELVRAFLEIGESVNPRFNILLTVTKDQAEEQARYADQRLAKGDPSPLLGIPVVFKDNFVTRGIRTTAGSKILDAYIGQYDATVVRRLVDQGMVMVGKGNLDAFAHGSSTENSDFGPTANPWDITKVPGGSSGGSAAAVAAQLCLAATGSDTGGSIRQPASFTNTVGLKPTYGRSSRYGVIAMGSSLDSIGCFTRTVEDCALVFGSMAGLDPADATSLPDKVPDYHSLLNQPIQGIKIGIAQEYFGDGIDARIKASVEAARAVFERLGATFVPVKLPHTKYALAAYYIIAPSEISANLSRYDGIRYGYSHQAGQSLLDVYEQSRADGFGAEAKRRIMLGTYALSSGYYDAYYKRAQQVRTLVRHDFSSAFAQVDALLAPVSPTLPFALGEKTENPLAMYLADALTVPVNLAGLPALALPCGFAENLPIGMQLIGPDLSESRLFSLGHHYQRETDWHQRIAEVG
jgi:aspartyl-tRNA(Asn)/glutamyl-tRNA(Gln) amidotransferase subunit A